MGLGLCNLFCNLFGSEKHSTSLKSAVKDLEPQQRQGMIEEELLPNYKPCDFYAVHIGKVLHKRYKVLAKLGFGASSTVWFCRDLPLKRYVAIKICTATKSRASSQSADRELVAHTRLNNLRKTSSHPGLEHIRHAEEMFTLKGLYDQRHQCFVYQPACATLSDLCRPKVTVVKDPSWLKDVLRSTLRALDFLHSEARITHADLKPDNIFFSCPAWTLDLFAERIRQQKPQGRFDGRGKKIVYRSVSFLDLLSENDLCIGRTLLGDFGCAETAREDNEKGVFRARTVAVEPFRAPETILQMPWTGAVDVWAFGVLAWVCFAKKYLFCDGHAHNDDFEWAMSQHLAQVVGLLGAPGKDFLRKASGKGSRKSRWWGLEGAWRDTDGAEVQRKCWEDMVAGLRMEEVEKKALVKFMKEAMTWDPEDRASAGRLLEGSFLRS